MAMEFSDANGTWSKSSEEVRRSLDVLDKVLSEFDDIDASNEDLNAADKTSGDDEDRATEEKASPPPIDRTLKPQENKPALPKKERRTPSLQRGRNAVDHVESSPAESLKRSASETSSHEYQEINSDLVGSNRRSKSLNRNINNESLFRPIKAANQKNPNQERQNNVLNDGNRGRARIKEAGVHKGRLRDNIPSDSKLLREKIQKRKIPQRKSKSSERIPNQRKKPHSCTRPVVNNTGEFYHPNQFEQIPLDPRLLDQGLLNTIPLDPRLRHRMDQMLLRDPISYIPQFSMMDNQAYIPDDQIPFPHLLHNPNIPLGIPPPMQMPYYPEDLSNDLIEPDFPPHLIPNAYMPIDPLNYNYPYPIPLENIDPTIAARTGLCPPEYAFDVPLPYYELDPMNYPITNEKYGYQMPAYLDKTMPLHEIDRMWMASQQEQIALHNLRNYQQMNADHLISGHGERINLNEINNLNRLHYQRSNSASDRTEMRRNIQRNKLKKSASHSVPRTESLSSETSFRVGEEVNCLRDDGDEILSPTNFSSGGKDSGFDETPPIEDLTNRESKSPHPGTGGGFIVSGVFNDSSKMYIPAPPSPTPDYEGNCCDSEGEESDILQSSLYHVKPMRDQKNHQNRRQDSLSDDSLQDTSDCPKLENNVKSLQTMIKEFHNGLPPALHESYSDDSLDESSTSPRPSSIGIKSRRIMSMESLTSIDGSTTSFDYVKGGSSKNATKNKLNIKRHSSYFSDIVTHSSPSANEKHVARGKGVSKKEASKKPEKFNTIRNLMKDGLLEGLDEQPPDFMPPPANKGSLEKNDSGMSSSASTTKTNDSAESSTKSSNSSFSDKMVKKPVSAKKLKTKEPAPQPPAIRNSSSPRQNTSSPNSHSWLHKQKRQAPIPNETSKLRLEKKKEKVTHVDAVQQNYCRNEDINGMSKNIRNKQQPEKDRKYTNVIEKHRISPTNHDSIDSRINHPVFSGPMVTTDIQLPKVSETVIQQEFAGKNRLPIIKPAERSVIKETTERDVSGKPRKNSIELNSSPLNYAINKHSKRDVTPYNSSFTASKKFHEVKQNSNWSPKLSEDSPKSRFNIFKGFWRRNKYSFDKF